MDHDEFYAKVLIYCGLMCASFTSGFRTQKHNEAVGGVSNSLHLVGLAVDVVYDEEQPSAFKQSIATRLGLLVLEEDDHDHIQPRGM